MTRSHKRIEQNARRPAANRQACGVCSGAVRQPLRRPSRPIGFERGQKYNGGATNTLSSGLRLQPAAPRELNEADCYDSEGPGPGAAFIDEVERAMNQILQFPAPVHLR